MGIIVVGGSGFIGTRFDTLITRDGIDFKIVDKAISGVFPNQTAFCLLNPLGTAFHFMIRR